MTQDTEVEKFDAWVAAFENQHGAIDEESALCAWQARAALEANQADHIADGGKIVAGAEVVRSNGGVTVSRVNLTEAGKKSLESKADHIGDITEMVKMPEPVGYINTHGTYERRDYYHDLLHNSSGSEREYLVSSRVEVYTKDQLRTLLAQHGIKIAD